MLVLVRAITKRTWSQLWRYFATVYVVGFGTGSSYDTLPVNLLSAERDLGLRPEVARVSIVLGTVLNKNVATMAVLLVTVSTCALLDLPLSMTEIAILIPPVMILGLESPGIPGGAGVFMSPVVASLLAVPDPGRVRHHVRHAVLGPHPHARHGGQHDRRRLRGRHRERLLHGAGEGRSGH